MQEFAKSKGMEVIPLVQTFGHMEVKLTPCSLVYNYCKKNGLKYPILKMVFNISVCPYFHCINGLLLSLFCHSLC